MPFALKTRKSAGVPVTTTVHRLLKSANTARDAGDWAMAAAGYRAALDLAPVLTHIWVQLGHALKEDGDVEGAKAAYEEAARLAPSDPDPPLHLGHLAKTQGDPAGAARAYLASARLDPGGDAVSSLRGLVHDNTPMPVGAFEAWLTTSARADLTMSSGTDQLAERAQEAVNALATALKREDGPNSAAVESAASAARLIASLQLNRPLNATDADARSCLIFDVSDLIAYFRNVRSPTGIQRVQIETTVSALKGGADVRICCFIEARDEWVEIPEPIFTRLCALSLDGLESQAAEWNLALNGALMTLGVAPPLEFPRGAFLINLGTSWWLQNYFLQIRRIKQKHAVRYVPFVHDMIPVLFGEFCPKPLTRDFISWAIGVFEHADFFFVNSESTKRDLIRVGAFLGREIAPTHVSVVRLDADIRKADRGPVQDDALRIHGIGAQPFVLFVSTIEPRKNHLRVFEAWLALLKRHGPRRVPKLVCVGHPGWLNDTIHEQLKAHEALRDHVHRLMFVSDEELSQLYRRCLFTLYPSFYEGWGLPVTESLCHGKVPVVSEVSSLPEAGGPFAVYFDPHSTPALVRALETMMFDGAARATRERKIAAEFRPRTWPDLAGQMNRDVETWSAATDFREAATPPAAQIGAYHPLRRNLSTRLWPAMRAGEIYRDGVNWWSPDDWGCWTKIGGATLRLSVPSAEPLLAYLHLRGLPSTPCSYVISVGDEGRRGDLAPGQDRWVKLDVPAEAVVDGTLGVSLTGAVGEDLGGCTNGSDRRIVSLGLAGFYLCRAADDPARMTLMEAVALGNLDDIAFNREPYDYAPLVQ
ncbi:glycosyltransferase [Caulobacter sp. CCNWLY153]|uniref:glycosyltransferase n=1 Tax=unclassified Caulobacter TaxID=2648921 RepID=UPI002FEEC76D